LLVNQRVGQRLRSIRRLGAKAYRRVSARSSRTLYGRGALCARRFHL